MADIQPVKILYLHPTFTFGGAERTSLNLLTGLDKQRFKVTLVTSKEIALRFSGLALEKIIHIEDIGMGIWFRGLKSLWKDVRIVAKVVKEEKPDIVFGMMHYSATALAFAKKFFRLKPKIIASPRGPSTDYLNTCFTKKSQKVFLKALFSFFCKRSDALIVPSSGTKEDCVKNFGAKGERVSVINNSIDAGLISEKCKEGIDIEFPADTFVVSTAGRLSMEKNMPLLLKAFAKLREKENAKLLIIGDGPEKANLEAVASELGIREDIIFTGFQENPYKYIKRSDVFVHTCLVEGFGNMIVEAMACGVPVIATDCPYGPREIIQNGENGILAPMDDTEALVEAIRSVLYDEGLRQRLSGKGYQRSLDFSIGRMVRAYEDVFLRLWEMKKP